MTGRVLIADAVANNRIALAAALGRAFYEVIPVASGAEALRALHRQRPDVVIASTALPDMKARVFCTRAQVMADRGDTPILLLGEGQDRAERHALLAAGADDVLDQPVDRGLLLARLRNRLRARAADAELTLRDDTRRALGLADAAGAPFQPPARVALIAVSAGPEIDRAIACLQARLSDRIERMTAEQALRPSATPPEAFVVVETGAPARGGLALLTQLRASPRHQRAALLYVCDAAHPKQATGALDLGADDLLTRGFDAAELALRLPRQIARKRRRDSLRANMRHGLHAAITDPLTGLHNRRYALPHLSRLCERAVERGRGFSLLLADLDHFKRINDRHGHAAGDAVLCEVARRMCGEVRLSDLVARFGGEEFLVILPDSDEAAARSSAERLRAALAAGPFVLPGGGACASATVSIGLAACADGERIASDVLLDRADRALYAAKDRGRDRVLAWSDLRPGPRVLSASG